MDLFLDFIVYFGGDGEKGLGLLKRFRRSYQRIMSRRKTHLEVAPN
jgi:hypothetical protein